MKQLLPHQVEDAVFLASKQFAGCFSGMGSGKTLTALEATRLVNQRALCEAATIGSAPAPRTIIVGPPISLNMWFEEYEEFIGLPAQIIRTGKEPLQNVSCFIMSYEIATKRRDELKDLVANVLICDESHALKSPDAKRTKAIIGRHGICESVDHSWLLTGTPSTRWNDDLFTFMARADNEALRNKIGKVDLKRFRLRYCVTQQKKFSARQRFATEVTVGNRNTPELNDMLFGGMAVRRELADVWKEMPPITINRLQVGLESSPDLTEILRGMAKQTVNQVRKDMAAGEEHISTLRRLLGKAKVKNSAKEIISRIEAGVTPILVGCWHTEVIDKMEEVLEDAGVSCAVLDGRTPIKAKARIQAAFNAGEIDVLVGQISAMGVSLNLQGGSHIVVIEEDWSPAVMAQFYARCHRIGQANHVHVDIFTSDSKLDKAVREISANKRRGHTTLLNQEAVA